MPCEYQCAFSSIPIFSAKYSCYVSQNYCSWHSYTTVRASCKLWGCHQHPCSFYAIAYACARVGHQIDHDLRAAKLPAMDGDLYRLYITVVLSVSDV